MVSSLGSCAQPAACGTVLIAFLPPNLPEPHAPPEVELDAFVLEQLPLGQLGAGRRPEAHAAGRVDDPMPRDRGRRRQRVQRIAHLPRVARQPGKLGDLTVGGHPPARDAADDGVDPRVAVRAGAFAAHARNVTGLQTREGACVRMPLDPAPVAPRAYAGTGFSSRTTRVSSLTFTAPRSGAIDPPLRSTHAW